MFKTGTSERKKTHGAFFFFFFAPSVGADVPGLLDPRRCAGRRAAEVRAEVLGGFRDGWIGFLHPQRRTVQVTVVCTMGVHVFGS